MTNNILRHFAINDLKTHRKDTLIAIITITILSIIFMATQYLYPIFLYQDYLDTAYQYGTKNYEAFRVDYQTIQNASYYVDGDKATLHDKRIQYAITDEVYVTALGDPIVYVEGNGDVIGMSLLIGRMPVSENEIAIQEDILLKWGYEVTLDQTIQLPCKEYIDEDQNLFTTEIKEFQVVGILEKRGDCFIVVGKSDDLSSVKLSIDVGRNHTIHSSSLILSQSYQIEPLAIEAMAYFLTIFYAILLVVASTILSGYTFASFENRKHDYTLLRGIGATNRQIYYVVLIQSLILTMISLIITCLFQLVIIIVAHYVVDPIIPLSFTWVDFLTCSIIILGIVTLNYFMPARKSTRQALTSAFEGQEFEYFYHRYKKLHYMRPFYLAYRQLISFKKQMVIRVILIFIMCNSLIGALSSYYSQMINQSDNSLQQSSTQTHVGIKSQQYNIQAINTVKAYASDSYEYHYVYDWEEIFRYENGTDFIHVSLYESNHDLKEKYNLKELNHNEIMISQGLNSYYKNPKTITINNKDYVVVDVINYHLEDYYDYIIFSSQDYQKEFLDETTYCFELTFDDHVHKRNGIIGYYQNLNSSQGEECYERSPVEYVDESMNYSQIVFYMAMGLGWGVIYAYQLAYEIMKQREMIGTYQLIGLTKKEIVSIYGLKSLYISLIGYGLALFFSFSTGINVMFDMTMIITMAITPIIFIIIFNIISLMPLLTILKKTGLENKHFRE